MPYNPQKITAGEEKHIQDIFKAGGVIAFPSDTSYGLAADPRNQCALEKLYAIKGRMTNKAVSCIFQSVEDMKKWAVINDMQEKILRQ